MKITSPDSWPNSVKFSIKLLTVLFAVLLIWQSVVPAGQGGSLPHLDKLVHLAVYAVLAGMMRLGWPQLWGGFILLSCGALGLALEGLQGAMNLGRTASMADAAANIIGVCLAVVILPRMWK